MLGSHVPGGGPVRRLEDLRRAGRKRDLAGGRGLADPNDPRDVGSDALEFQPLRDEHARPHTVSLAQESQQQVLGADVVVVELACLFLSADQDLPRPFRKSFEHRSRRNSTARTEGLESIHDLQSRKEPPVAVDPKRTAVVLIEYQNDFTSEGGALHGAVKDVMDSTGMLDNTRRLVEAAREAGATIVHAPDHVRAGIRRARRASIRDPQGRCRLDRVRQGRMGRRDRRRARPSGGRCDRRRQARS